MDRHRVAFLDRDGVLNEKAPEGDYIKSWSEFHFLPGVPEALVTLRELGFLLVVVTNQRCVARGIVSREMLQEIHARMTRELSARGVNLDAVYYCPHDIQDRCDCRKPKPGMLLSAIRAFGKTGIQVDLDKSLIVGDSEADILAGKAAGIRTAFIGSACAGADSSADSLGDLVRGIAEVDVVVERGRS